MQKNSLGSTDKKKSVIEFLEVVVFAVILAAIIRTFLFSAYKIPSESMTETLLVGDQLLATRFDYGVKIPFTDTYIYRGSAPERGDIIIFKYPKDPSVDFIKRIVGVPGDVIEVRNKQLYRNGEAVKESYIHHTDTRVQPIRDQFGPVTVPPDKVFVMGDNRDNSLDSRFWGFVDRKAIQARAWRIYWSWGSLTDIRWSRIGTYLR